MSRWRQAALGLAVVLGVLGMAGCSDDNGGGGSGSGGDRALVGNWLMTSMSVNGSGFFPPANIGWEVRLQMGEDGSLTVREVWKGSSESSSGGWTAGGGQLTLSAGWYRWTGAYTASAQTFRLNGVADYDGEGDTGSFVFTRQ